MRHKNLILFLFLLFFLALSFPVFAAENSHQGAQEHINLGEILSLYSILPFVGILLSIALFPLFSPEFWHHHFGKVSAFWATVIAVPLLIAYKGAALHSFLHIILADYIPFIILLWGLFTISGGILLKGSLGGNTQGKYHYDYHRNRFSFLDGNNRSGHATYKAIFKGQ